MTAPAPSADAVAAFLAEHHGAPVTEVERLRGGLWSAAFSYLVEGRELVARFGQIREGFEMDRAAMAFARPDLPVPEVLAIGEALGGSFAISVRHHGRFLEEIGPAEAAAAGPAVERLLAALRSVPSEPGAGADWFSAGPAPPQSTWRGWLADALVDDPRRRVSGWRKALAEDASADRLFRACEVRLAELIEACPERRDLVHGDLLHQNVLLSDDLAEVTGVFSWKCSVRGDFLFDVAWCTFWAPWYPGVVAADVWGRMSSAADVEGDEAWADAALRHHCYEVRIGGAHLGWHAWTGDAEGLRSVAARLVEVLERGPLAGP